MRPLPGSCESHSAAEKYMYGEMMTLLVKAKRVTSSGSGAWVLSEARAAHRGRAGVGSEPAWIKEYTDRFYASRERLHALVAKFDAARAK